MRRFVMRFVALAAALALTVTIALPAAAGEVQTLGKGVAGTDVVALADLVAHADQYVGKTVRVEGIVTDVCPMRGCWMDIASGDKSGTIRIKVDDGVIVFPKGATGKHAIAEGVFTKIEMTKDEAVAHAEHLAEERGEKLDAGKAKDLPTVVYQIRGTGAVIK
jgi:hypothetical protein